MLSPVDLRQLTDFLSTYQVSQINAHTILLTSKKSNLLVKLHRVDGDYDEIIQILDKHLSFDREYVCPLLHFEPCDYGQDDQMIRAVYQLDKMSLKDSIDIRREKEEPFGEPEMWIILSSIVNSLIYLQSKEVVYGVLSPNKIFIEEKIRVMDPSAFNLNPINISRLSLLSPDITNNQDGLDFYQSDVYLLALCILSACTLTHITNNVTEEQIQALLKQVENTYSSDLLHVLKHMLMADAEERPTLQNIQEYIEKQIQIKQAKTNSSQPLLQDEEDSASQQYFLQQIDHQNIDILQDEQDNNCCLNQYQQARQKYIYSTCDRTHNHPTNCQTSFESIQHLDSIQYIGQKDTINLIKSNCFVEEFKLTQFGSSSARHDTISKPKKRAHQIKKRNSEAVKTIHSIILPHNESTYTSPEIMSMLKQSTKRARQFMGGTSRLIKQSC